jgi:hypothetical protein
MFKKGGQNLQLFSANVKQGPSALTKNNGDQIQAGNINRSKVCMNRKKYENNFSQQFKNLPRPLFRPRPICACKKISNTSRDPVPIS